jgi:glycosyltransferase involved in cell wall biosynthesis
VVLADPFELAVATTRLFAKDMPVTEKLTILQVVPRLETGGSEQATVEITEALTRAGAKALVATEGGRMATAVTQAGGEIIRFPLASKNPATMLANARRLAKLVADHNVSLVHARSRAPAWSAFFAARRTGRPFVTTYHGAYSSRVPLKTFYSGVMARGDRVIANSRYTAALIAARHHVPMARIRVIYRGIDLSRFTPDAVAQDRLDRLRAAWGVKEGQPIVLHAARLTSWKGQAYVIDAAQRLRAANKLGEAVFILAGDAQGRDAYRQELADRIEGAGLGDRVRLVGHCDDMPAAFTLAHVALIASTSAETFGRTSIESQALGCPVVLTDIGAAPENVIPAGATADFTGWVVPAANSTALANAIGAALALSPAERDALGTRARDHVTAQFALEKMQRATLAVYDELLGSDLAARLR